MKNRHKKKIIYIYYLLRLVESCKCYSVTALIYPNYGGGGARARRSSAICGPAKQFKELFSLCPNHFR